MNKTLAALAAATFLACILLANYVTTEYGMIPVWPEPLLYATAGTYFAGFTFVLRDVIHDALTSKAHNAWEKLWALAPMFGLIILGAGLSFAISAPFIALASGVAFLASELADLAIYAPLRERGYLRAAIASNVVGAFVDTVLFLWIAGFPIAGAIGGQMVGKVAIGLVGALVIKALINHNRKAVTA